MVIESSDYQVQLNVVVLTVQLIVEGAFEIPELIITKNFFWKVKFYKQKNDSFECPLSAMNCTTKKFFQNVLSTVDFSGSITYWRSVIRFPELYVLARLLFIEKPFPTSTLSYLRLLIVLKICDLCFLHIAVVLCFFFSPTVKHWCASNRGAVALT